MQKRLDEIGKKTRFRRPIDAGRRSISGRIQRGRPKIKRPGQASVSL